MTWLRDTTERALRTFVQAWLMAWIVIEDHTIRQLFTEDVLTIGVGAAAIAIVLALAARAKSDSNSASFQNLTN